MLGCEIAHRSEHAEATNIASSHQTLVDERSQGLDIRIRHPLRGIERPASAEHRYCGEQPSFVRTQQVERPLDYCPHHLASCLGISPCSGNDEPATIAFDELC